MKVIILAAGSATRLGNQIKELPKCFLEVNGKSILERQLMLFKKFGMTDIVIIVGPHKEKFNFQNVKYIEDSQFNEHDVLGSLMMARSIMNGDILVSYSDILFDESILKKMIDFNGDIGIAVDLEWEESYDNRTQHPKEEADNVLIENNHILKIKKNISNANNNQLLGEFVGLMKLSKTGSKIFTEKYNYIEKTYISHFHEAPSLKKAYLTDMIQELIENNIEINPIIISGKWCEIDTSQDLERARKIFF